MEIPDFTIEHIKALPLRAIVAFAARCARRVGPLAQLPEGHPQREGRRWAIDEALGMAEAFARGTNGPPDESVVEAIDASRGVAGGPGGSADAAASAAAAAHAAASAWELTGLSATDKGEPGELKTAEARKFLGALTYVTADLAALAAFTAAVDAFTSVGYHNEDFVNAALNDYDRLLRLKLGRYPEPGDPIDPSPGGPLGPL
jgi:hypothetical protein